MTSNPLRSRAGFTYIAVLVMVVVMGIMLAQAARVWTTTMQREREEELIFRGTQIRDALRRWYNVKATVTGTLMPATMPLPPPRGLLPDLKALVDDPNMTAKTHFLRPFCLVDPMTGKDWALVKDPSQKIIGVASTSEAQPIKMGNFPYDLDPGDFEGKKKYTEWQFIYNRVPKPAAGGAINTKPK